MCSLEQTEIQRLRQENKRDLCDSGRVVACIAAPDYHVLLRQSVVVAANHHNRQTELGIN